MGSSRRPNRFGSPTMTLVTSAVKTFVRDVESGLRDAESLRLVWRWLQPDHPCAGTRAPPVPMPLRPQIATTVTAPSKPTKSEGLRVYSGIPTLDAMAAIMRSIRLGLGLRPDARVKVTNVP